MPIRTVTHTSKLRTPWAAIALALLGLTASPLGAQTAYNINQIDEQTITVRLGSPIRLYDSGGPTGRYSNNEGYVATFKSENGEPLVIKFSEFSTERNHDFLYIFEGEQSTVQLGDELARLSGTTIPHAYVIPTGSMVVDFKSDNSNPWLSNYTGFSAEIRVLPITEAPPVTSCSATFTDDGGPMGNYNTERATKYVFHSAEPGKDVRLDFSEFSLGGQDVLKIYDGPSDSSLLIGTYRNTESPGTVMSSGPVMSVYHFAGGTSGAGWVAQMTCFSSTTYYSYGHGDWNNPASWTTDPSASVRVNPTNSYPQELDRAVIMNGHTIVAKTNGNKVVTLDLREGGTLDVGYTTGNNLRTVSGTGTLRSARAELPSGNYNLFVQPDGGTVVLYGTGTDALNQPILNNLVVEKSGGHTAITQSLLIRGSLDINSGTVRSSFAANGGSITVEGDITVNIGATVEVNGSPATLYAQGDLTNRGTLRLTSKTTAGYTSHAASYLTLCFGNPNKDQTFTCNGPAYLEKLQVSKGHDDTHTLYVRANSSSHFNLYGRNNEDFSGDPLSIENNKALDIQSGTLHLGANINIARLLTDQGDLQAGNSFAIDQDAALVLDGAQVNMSVAAPAGRYSATRSSLIVYGRLRVTGTSTLTEMGSQGIILREYGVVEIDGSATVNTPILRTSSRTDQGAHRGTFIMSGGTLSISGAAGITESVFDSHPPFVLPFPDNTFHMSGGTITVNSPNNNGESWLVSASPNNITVTGGTVNVRTTATGGSINSTAPFHHLNINGAGTASLNPVPERSSNNSVTVPAAPRRPLVVQGNLVVANGATLNAQSMNVTVGGDFVANGTYAPGQNSTIFNGHGLQLFDPSQGSIINGMSSMRVTNSSVLSVGANISVRDTLRIDEDALLKDMGHTVQHQGAVLHMSGTHESEPQGAISLSGNATQLIEGNGRGAFGNLTLDKPSGTTSLMASIRINGNLRLAGAAASSESVLNIGGHQLLLGINARIYSALSGTAQNFGNKRMVQTQGQPSDLGLRKEWGGTGTFTYPVGAFGSYTPAQLSISTAPAQWGSVAVAPVDGQHPLSTGPNCLKHYWNLQSDGMTGLSAGSSRLNLYYQDAMVEGDENQYQAARYYPPEWTLYDAAQNPVTTLTNEIRFTQLTELRGHFTAAQTSACGLVQAYYSNVEHGEWSSPASWTTEPATNTPAGSTPSEHSPVVIRPGHTISITDGPKTTGSLSIQAGGVLDLTTTRGHNFGIVNDSHGRLRISTTIDTASFPSGDFGEFLSTGGGTVEYYTTGSQSFVMPNLSQSTSKPTADIKSIYDITDRGTNWINVNTAMANAANVLGLLKYRPANLSHASMAYVDITIARVQNSGNITTFALYASTSGERDEEFQYVAAIPKSSGVHRISLDNFVGASEVRLAIGFQSSRASSSCFIELADIKSYHIPGIPHNGGSGYSGSATHYNNLIINPSTNLSIELPDEPLDVWGSLTVQGAGIVHTSKAAPTTLHVYGPARVAGQGTLSIDNGNSFTLALHDSLRVAPNGSLAVASAGPNALHSILLMGHVENNGRINLSNNGHHADIRLCGLTNQTFSGTGSEAKLYRVYVDKGADPSPMADITASRFDLPTTLAQALFIQNGTIRFSGSDLQPVLSSGAFSIPSTGCLSVNGSAVAVCKSGSNSADLLLCGRLEVQAGSMCVGDTLLRANNDIEYAASTPSELTVTGGRLVVNGQIRRSVTNANGDLRYAQHGGRVYINGHSRESKRPLLEVLNSGHFEMHGGHLLLVNGTGTTASPLGELLLNPATHSVSGGTITIGTSSTEANANRFDLDLACPIFNLTVDGSGLAKHARLRIHEATIRGSLVVDGPASSQFIANGIDLKIAGDLISRSADANFSFDYRPVSQRTTFNGHQQRIEKESAGGYLLFGEVAVSLQPGGKLSHTANQSNNSIIINGDLILDNGSLEQSAGTMLEPRRNVYVRNGFTHTSLGSSTMLFYSTTADQHIYSDGTGSLGRIQLYMHDVVLNGDLLLNNGLNFSRVAEGSSRRLIINEHRLTFGEAARVGTGATAPNESRYIVTNGALSDAGVSKLFGAGGGTFTFPVGVGNAGGKYTPATISVGGSTAGSITVTPVDAPHPGCTNTTTDEQLQYFWRVSSSGFGTLGSVSHTYAYQQADVQGNENEYIGARYHSDTYEWDSPVGAVDAPQNTIGLAGVSYIDGEYTAGQPVNAANELNFGNINIYFSRQNGPWEDASTWLVAHPSDPSNRQPATKAPSGNPVSILDGHTVSITADWAYASSVDIAPTATLDVGRTLFHNLGHISGAGTIAITSNTSDSEEGGYFKFPGGDAAQFMSTSGSLVRYSGNGVLPANIKTYMNVEFAGSSTKKHIPAVELTVQENLTIAAGQLLAYAKNPYYNINVQGSWRNNVANGFVPSKGQVTFKGKQNSTIEANSGETFYNLRIYKSGTARVELNSPVAISNRLLLTHGNVLSTSTNMLTVTNTNIASVQGGSDKTFIDGPLRRMLSNGATNVHFPVGNKARYGELRLHNVSQSGDQPWIAEYFDQAPNDADNLAEPLEVLSDNEFWTLSGASGTQSNVQLRWDGQSGAIVQGDLDKLRVARRLPPWTKAGDKVNPAAQTVSTTTPMSLGGSAVELTLAVEHTATARITGSSTASVCDDGTTIEIYYTATGDGPLTVVFHVDGQPLHTATNIGSGSSNTLYLSYAQLGLPGVHTVSIAEVRDRNGRKGIVQGSPTSVETKATPKPIITGNNSVMTNSSTTYNVSPTSGDTYQWSTDALGTINGSSTEANATISWGSTMGTSTLTLVQTSPSGCSTTATMTIEVRDWPSIAGSTTVCAGSTATYSTKPVSGHSYSWHVEGGTIASGAGTASITVQWSSQTMGRITLRQGPAGSEQQIEQDITIAPLPVATIAATMDTVCSGHTALLSLGGINLEPTYTLMLEQQADNGSWITVGSHSTVGTVSVGPLEWTQPTPASHAKAIKFRLHVLNGDTGCMGPHTESQVVVLKTPQTGPQYHIPNDK
ncbi:MAG: CUB domain-containing protein [Bacteroidales bacterium]|nr:CUB domain-containing protein [Bacteroidales bacterium]